MNTIMNPPVFNYRSHVDILKSLLIIANVIAISVSVLLRIIFYDLPFVLTDDLRHMGNAALTASAVAVAVSVVLFAIDGIIFLIKKRKYSVRHVALRKSEYKLGRANQSLVLSQ
jgi:hypothetical protein